MARRERREIPAPERPAQQLVLHVRRVEEDPVSACLETEMTGHHRIEPRMPLPQGG